MKPDEWRRVYELYERACDFPIDERRSYLHSSGAGSEIIAEVLALLEHSDDSSAASESLAHKGAINGLSAGTVLGRYVVAEPIGNGAMGSVYAARDTELDRSVALKFLNRRA